MNIKYFSKIKKLLFLIFLFLVYGNHLYAQNVLTIPVPLSSNYVITSLFDHDIPNPTLPENNNFIRYDGRQWTDGSASRYGNVCTNGINCYDGHNGIDFAVASTTPVMAAAPGTVVENSYSMCGGYTTRVWHPTENYSTLYAHLLTQLISVNSPVGRFDVIARSGSSGTCTSGPHLHFGLREGRTFGQNIDPYGWSGSGRDPWVYNIGYLWTTNPPSLTPPPVSTLPVVNISTDITQNTTWTSGRIYLISNVVTINPGITLTINSGAVVKFQNQYIYIQVNGTLIARGTEQDKIYFTSYKDDSIGGDTNGDGTTTLPAPSDYRGFVVSTNGILNFEHSIIRYGGYEQCGWVSCTQPAVIVGPLVNATSTIISNNRGGIYVIDGAINIVNSTITNNVESGIRNWYFSGRSNFNIISSTISQNGLDGISISGNPTAVNLSISDSIISENSGHGVFVSAQSIPLNISITNTDFINNRNGDGSFGGYQTQLNFINSGNTSTSTSPNKNGFYLGSTFVGSQILNPGVPFIIEGRMDVGLNSSLTISPGAILKFNTRSFMSIDGSLQINGTEQDKIYFTSYKDDSIGGDSNGDGASSVPQAGDYQGLYITRGPVNISNAVMQYGGADHCTSSCILPGMIFNGSSLFALNISSSVLSNNVYGIYSQNSATTTISDTIIENSTYRGISMIISSSIPANLSISDSVISGSAREGVHVGAPNGGYLNLSVTNSRFLNNLEGDVIVPTYSYTPVTNLNFINSGNSSTGSGKKGFYIGGTITENQIWNPGVVIIPGIVTVPVGKTLTINSGVIVKFSGYPSSIRVDGNLSALGTKTKQIYFTSYKDDSIGGDTNGDGSTTLPAPNDFAGIILTGAGNANIYKATLRYGGMCSGSMGCSIPGPLANTGVGSLSIDSSIITQNGYGIYRNNSSGSVTVSQSAIFGNSWGIYDLYNNSNISARNNWWGHSSGPMASANPNGLGDRIFGNAIFSPWLSSCSIPGCSPSRNTNR